MLLLFKERDTSHTLFRVSHRHATPQHRAHSQLAGTVLLQRAHVIPHGGAVLEPPAAEFPRLSESVVPLFLSLISN